jgi:hypothetical protein
MRWAEFANVESISREPMGGRSESVQWTTSAYDALSRIISVTTSGDGAQVLTSYSGNTAL